MAHSQVLGVLKIDLILSESIFFDQEGNQIVYLLWYSCAVDSDILKEVHNGLVLLDLLGIECDLFESRGAGLANIELLFILAGFEADDEFRDKVEALRILGEEVSSERDFLLADQAVADIGVCDLGG